MILDANMRPVQPGTAGEICIAGCGVALGYTGQPGLTAQRFPPDPGGRLGCRMYRTGDVGRWRGDGALEVIGRADRQVKISGYRVEPEDVEAALTAHPRIRHALVTTVPGAAGEARLIAYFAPDPDAARPSAKELRHHLARLLPGHMLPSALIAAAQWPPLPGESAQPPPPGRPSGEPAAPVETQLAALWARLLRRDHVGPDDDFFADGDSLLAAEMLASAQAAFKLPDRAVRSLTRRLLADPTLRGFATAIADARAGRLGDDADPADADLARDANPGVVIRPVFAGPGAPAWRAPRKVLLTGATGLLGAHLLAEILAATSARVWCLVRASTEEAGRQRLTTAAARYGLPAPLPERVIPLPGDLAAPGLGLTAAAAASLAREADVIFHVGGPVNFLYPYEALRPALVEGTREVIRLAAERGVPVHYTSSMAVLASLGAAGIREVREDTPLGHPALLRMGYLEAKHVAEEMVRAAARSGLPAAIYRPLDIVGSMATGAWGTSSELAALIRYIADTGLAPLADVPLDLVPADVCAAAIRHIAATQEPDGQTYHLVGPRPARLADLVARLRTRGYRVADLPLAAWAASLAEHAARDPAHPMAAFAPLFRDRDETGATVAEIAPRGHVPGLHPRGHREGAGGH